MFRWIATKLALARKRSGYRSRLGGLWIDRVDADALLDERLRLGELTETDAQLLRDWRRDGFVLLRNAISTELADRVNEFVEEVWRTQDPRVIVELGGDLSSVGAAERSQPNKLLDLAVYCEDVRRAALAEPILRFLRLAFDEDVLMFSNLSFERGSEQPVHQDSAYVVVENPLCLAASWVALENVSPGSGELEYYVGSHTLEDHLFAGRYKNWNRERDGHAAHRAYLQGLHERSHRLGLKRESFLPRKGDALVWSADLAHGGSAVTDRDLTRKSLVSHYCPASIRPYYWSYKRRQRWLVRCHEHASYTSGHYPRPR